MGYYDYEYEKVITTPGLFSFSFFSVNMIDDHRLIYWRDFSSSLPRMSDIIPSCRFASYGQVGYLGSLCPTLYWGKKNWPNNRQEEDLESDLGWDFPCSLLPSRLAPSPVLSVLVCIPFRLSSVFSPLIILFSSFTLFLYSCRWNSGNQTAAFFSRCMMKTSCCWRERGYVLVTGLGYLLTYPPALH